jgi:prepilin-type N-terminal cleavage/methylation domain-containing protein
MLRRPERGHGEDGFTLVEILMALVILSVAILVFVGVLTSLTVQTETHRGQGAVDTVARDWGEAIKQKALNATSYVQCPVWSDLNPSFTFPTGFSGSTPTVEYWVPSGANPQSGSFSSDRNQCTNFITNVQHCTATQLECDPGLQRVTLTVSAASASLKNAQTTTQVLVRRGNNP